MHLQPVIKKLIIIVIVYSCGQVYAQSNTAAEMYEGIWYSTFGNLNMVRAGDDQITCDYSYYKDGETVYGSLTGVTYTEYNDYTLAYEYNLVGTFKETIKGEEVAGEFEFLIVSSDLNSFGGFFSEGGAAVWDWDGTR